MLRLRHHIWCNAPMPVPANTQCPGGRLSQPPFRPPLLPIRTPVAPLLPLPMKLFPFVPQSSLPPPTAPDPILPLRSDRLSSLPPPPLPAPDCASKLVSWSCSYSV